VTLRSSPVRSSRNTCFEVLDCKITPKGTYEYGELASGTLRLLGSCMPVTWDSIDGSLIGFPVDSFSPDILLLGCDGESLRLDLVCLLLEVRHGGWYRSLILRRLQPDKDLFERVGFLDLCPSDGLYSWPAEKTVVEIV
jgi:hypothetical protein